MNLNEFNSSAGFPERKPWLNPVVNDFECKDATVHGRITQQGGLPTPYGAWASLGSFPLTSSGVATYAMGTFVGRADVPSNSLYPGAAYRIQIGGTVTTAGADNIVLSIRNLAGDHTFASVTLAVGGATASSAFSAEFDIQVAKLGGLGVGEVRSISRATIGTGAVSGTNNIVDTSGFDSANGLGLQLYMSHSTAGNNITRNIGYCVSTY